MIMKKNIQLLVLVLLIAAGMNACRKKEDPPIKIGQELPYNENVTKSLVELMDSIPEATLYRSA